MKPEGAKVYQNTHLCGCVDSANQDNSYCHPEARPGNCLVTHLAFTLPELAKRDEAIRWEALEEAAKFFNKLADDDIKRRKLSNHLSHWDCHAVADYIRALMEVK